MNDIISSLPSSALERIASNEAVELWLGPARLSITADTLTLSLGASRIRMTPDGITLVSPRVDLNPDDPVS